MLSRRKRKMERRRLRSRLIRLVLTRPRKKLRPLLKKLRLRLKLPRVRPRSPLLKLLPRRLHLPHLHLPHLHLLLLKPTLPLMPPRPLLMKQRRPRMK